MLPFNLAYEAHSFCWESHLFVKAALCLWSSIVFPFLESSTPGASHFRLLRSDVLFSAVVLDEPSYIRESLGLKKARETLLQALRAFWSALWRDNGRVYVTFSDPVSLRDWLHAKQGGGTNERR